MDFDSYSCVKQYFAFSNRNLGWRGKKSLVHLILCFSHLFISFTVPSFLSRFITLFSISSLSLHRVTVYCLCRCVPLENWLLFSLKWQSSDEALKCVEACPSALGSDWPSAIIQVVFECLNWIEPDQLNTELLSVESDVEVRVFIMFFYLPYRENNVLLLTNINSKGAVAGARSPLIASWQQKKFSFMAKDLVSANLLCGPELWIGLLNPNIAVTLFLFHYFLWGTEQMEGKKSCMEMFRFSSSTRLFPSIQGRKPASASQCAINGYA